jgi:hypothetical protein
VEKEERAGGQGQNALLPPLARIRTEVEGGAVAARRPSGPGRGRREGGKKEGDEGVLLPSSPWGRVRCGGRSWAAADCRLGQLGWRRGGVQWGRGDGLRRCGVRR